MKICDLSIIIPAYNEGKTIQELIQKIKMVDFSPWTREIIVVDDGSNDATPRILQTAKDIKVVRLKSNQGKGSAIREGLKYVQCDYVVIQDADLEYEPYDLYSLLSYAKSRGGLPVVYGSRNLKPKNERGGLFFYLGGVFLSQLANFLYGLHISDEPTCYKLLRRDVLDRINLRARHFEFCPEVTAKIARLGYDIPEVPINYRPRSIKEGKKIRLKDGLQAVWALIKYRILPISRL